MPVGPGRQLARIGLHKNFAPHAILTDHRRDAHLLPELRIPLAGSVDVRQLLEALQFNRSMEPDLVEWVKGLEPPLAKKLARGGLIPNPEAKAATTLEPFLESGRAARKGDYKSASLIAWRQVIDALTGFFGAEYVIPEEDRRRAQGPGGWANGNPRTTLKKSFAAPAWKPGHGCGIPYGQAAKRTWRGNSHWLWWRSGW